MSKKIQQKSSNRSKGKDLWDDCFHTLRPSLLATLGLSLLLAILTLFQPLYMMSLYSRVLTSMSANTLFALTGIALFVGLMIGIFEIIRSKILIEMSVHIDTKLSPHIFRALVNANRQDKFGSEGLGHLNTLRQFFSSQELTALFDAPFVPIFIVFMFLMHPALGAVNLIGLLIISLITWYSKKIKSQYDDQIKTTDQQQSKQANNAISNSGFVKVVGITEHLQKNWLESYEKFRETLYTVLTSQSILKAISQVMNYTFQIGIMGFTTYLILNGEATITALFAVTILVARTLMPVQQLIGGWSNIGNAQNSYEYLKKLLEAFSESSGHYTPNKCTGELKVSNLFVTIPGRPQPILNDISLKILPGDLLLLIGKSASGKSTLLRSILGLHKIAKGTVTIDGINFSEWSEEAHKNYIGYMPQNQSLFEGTIVDNITSFRPELNNQAIDLGLKLGLGDVVTRLPLGWEQNVKPWDTELSGGTAQRIAICRALLGSPQFIFLDEPLNHLDSETQIKLLELLNLEKKSGKSIVVVGHNPSLVEVSSKILYMTNGSIHQYGSTAEVIRAVNK